MMKMLPKKIQAYHIDKSNFDSVTYVTRVTPKNISYIYLCVYKKYKNKYLLRVQKTLKKVVTGVTTALQKEI